MFRPIAWNAAEREALLAEKKESVDLAFSLEESDYEGNVTRAEASTYRVFFTMDDDVGVVRVLHVRRGARQRPIAEELTGD